MNDILTRPQPPIPEPPTLEELRQAIQTADEHGWKLHELHTYRKEGEPKQHPPTGWPKRTCLPKVVDDRGRPTHGFGINLDPSGVVDIDCDCPEARALAPKFLPTTATFGRDYGDGLTVSHYLFSTEKRAHAENDPSKRPKKRVFKTDAGDTLLEIRRGKGQQTVIPPTVKPSGSRLCWVREPDTLTGWSPEVEQAVEDLALAILVARHGSGHESRLEWAATLLRMDIPIDRAERVMMHGCEYRGDRDLDDVRATLESTASRIEAGETVRGVAKDAQNDLRAFGFAPDAGGSAVYAACDSGNAHRFVDSDGKDWRYVRGLGWLHWDGARWVESTGPYDQLRRLAERMVEDGMRIGGEQGDGLRKWGRTSGNASRIDGAIKLLANDARLQLDPEKLDADPMLLNCPNGVLDLRTGKLRPHRREDFMTKVAAAAFDPSATAPRFERFLRECMDGDEGLVDYLLRFCGYCLTGDVSEHVMGLWSGGGRNGKSTLLNVLQQIMGDYARTIDSALLVDGRGSHHSTGQTDLRGLRLACCSEVPEGRPFNEALVKKLTGGDMITARRMRQDNISFMPTHKLVLACNSKPLVREDGDAFWARVQPVPWNVSFRGREDRGLQQALIDEAPGILALLARGCLAWLRDGLAPPDAVERAGEAYRADQDRIGAFIEDALVVDPSSRLRQKQLYELWRSWCEANGEVSGAARSFYRRLRERGVEFVGTGGKRCTVGFAVADSRGLTAVEGGGSEARAEDVPDWAKMLAEARPSAFAQNRDCGTGRTATSV